LTLATIYRFTNWQFLLLGINYVNENFVNNLLKFYINMSEIKIKPLGTRVLVKQIEAEAKTSSGIIIPDSAQEKPLQAKVLAVGNDANQVKVGETVLYGKFTGTELNIDNNNYLMLDVADILATI